MLFTKPLYKRKKIILTMRKISIIIIRNIFFSIINTNCDRETPMTFSLEFPISGICNAFLN